MAFIRSMYVAPNARGQGIGRRLRSTALARVSSWPRVEQVKLSVTASHESAVHLYQSVGFDGVGREPRALQIANEYFDELIMVRVMDCACSRLLLPVPDRTESRQQQSATDEAHPVGGRQMQFQDVHSDLPCFEGNKTKVRQRPFGLQIQGSITRITTRSEWGNLCDPRGSVRPEWQWH